MDLPFWIFLVLAAILILNTVLGNLNPKRNYNYSTLPTLLSPAERSFFGVLSQITDDSVIVFSKVRIADILRPQKGLNRSNWQRAFNRISSKHFDFVLCRKHDISFICAIELNDSSHNSHKRKKRDSLLRSICDSASLPLIEIAAKRSYNLDEIRNQINIKNAS